MEYWLAKMRFPMIPDRYILLAQDLVLYILLDNILLCHRHISLI